MSKSNKQTVREKAHQFMQGFIIESLALSIFNAMCTNSGLYQINNLGTGFFKTWKIEYDEK